MDASFEANQVPLEPDPATDQLRIVCLGASAGGLEALDVFFGKLPSTTNAAYVVVMHLSPDFKSMLPELLSKRTTMQVSAATDGEQLEPNHVYIIPPGTDMAVGGGRLHLEAQDRGATRILNLPIDRFLVSMANEVAQRGVAVILSGTGSDGTRGLRQVKEAGGAVLVQSPESAKFDGMPLSAIQTGLVDATGQPAGLAEQVSRILQDDLPRLDIDDGEEEEDSGPDEVLAQVFELLAKQGPDLSYFRHSMVSRRVQRRMQLSGIRSMADYLGLLRRNSDEVALLGNDLLIGVTQFFRTPEAYAALSSKVIPRILTSGLRDDPIRIWISACSTGQEVYSVLILFLEAMDKSGIRRPIKVFATDIDSRALAFASRGAYPASELADIPPALIPRYFAQKDGIYQINPEVRTSVIFARHNIVTDPPFTKLDLVACRNLLIYLRPYAQQYVLSSLYLALKPTDGVLLLGKAEDMGPLKTAFEQIDSRVKLFKRAGPLPVGMSIHRSMQDPISVVPMEPSSRVGLAVRDDAQLKLLRSSLEACFEAENRSAIIVREDMRVVDTLIDPLNLLRVPKGQPTDDLTRLLELALSSGVRSLMHRLEGEARAQVAVATSEGTRYEVRGIRLPSTVAEPGSILVLVTELGPLEGMITSEAIDFTAEARFGTLENELRKTKENLQATIEELQTANEEQQSTNEELLASNEELQSTNEELHSVNEELFTVNAEYHRRNEDLLTATADLDNLLESTGVGTLFIDDKLCVRRFTRNIARLVSLKREDVGRPVSDFRIRYADFELADVARDILYEDTPFEREFQAAGGSWLSIRGTRYDGPAGRVGVLFTVLDVTRIKNAEESARVVGDRLAEANRRLHEQESHLEDLMSIIAHDLKRPVLAIDGTLSLAAEDLEAGAPDQASKRVTEAQQALGALRRLLGDLTSLSQQTLVQGGREEVDILPWLDELLEPFEERAKREAVRLQWATDGTRTSFVRVAAGQAMVNLVENAFVHGTSSPNPRIDVLCAIGADRLTIKVIDNGKGVAARDQERIFELFRQLDPSKTEGSGIGLVAARRLARQAGGDVRLEGGDAPGARFVLELPIDDHRPDFFPRGNANDLPILIVEDDAIAQKAFRRAFDDSTNLVAVSTLADAKERLERERFGVIVLDLALPDGHGLDLLVALPSSLNASTPIVLNSGRLDGVSEDALRGVNIVGSFQKDEGSEGLVVDLVHRVSRAEA